MYYLRIVGMLHHNRWSVVRDWLKYSSGATRYVLYADEAKIMDLVAICCSSSPLLEAANRQFTSVYTKSISAEEYEEEARTAIENHTDWIDSEFGCSVDKMPEIVDELEELLAQDRIPNLKLEDSKEYAIVDL